MTTLPELDAALKQSKRLHRHFRGLLLDETWGMRQYELTQTILETSRRIQELKQARMEMLLAMADQGLLTDPAHRAEVLTFRQEELDSKKAASQLLVRDLAILDVYNPSDRHARDRITRNMDAHNEHTLEAANDLARLRASWA